MDLNKRTQGLDSDAKRTTAKPSTRHCVHASHLAAGIEEWDAIVGIPTVRSANQQMEL